MSGRHRAPAPRMSVRLAAGQRLRRWLQSGVFAEVGPPVDLVWLRHRLRVRAMRRHRRENLANGLAAYREYQRHLLATAPGNHVWTGSLNS